VLLKLSWEPGWLQKNLNFYPCTHITPTVGFEGLPEAACGGRETGAHVLGAPPRPRTVEQHSELVAAQVEVGAVLGTQLLEGRAETRDPETTK
jgi:hypothetical protein